MTVMSYWFLPCRLITVLLLVYDCDSVLSLYIVNSHNNNARKSLLDGFRHSITVLTVMIWPLWTTYAGNWFSLLRYTYAPQILHTFVRVKPSTQLHYGKIELQQNKLLLRIFYCRLPLIHNKAMRKLQWNFIWGGWTLTVLFSCIVPHIGNKTVFDDWRDLSRPRNCNKSKVNLQWNKLFFYLDSYIADIGTSATKARIVLQ